MKHDRVILHVGTGKTGTSTIQLFLHKNRERLRESGFFCLGPGDLVSYPQNEQTWNTDALSRGLQELNQRMKEACTNSMIWSRESLSIYSFIEAAERVRMIKDELSASHSRVVIYLRRQDHMARSAYLQWGIISKMYPGPVLGFDEWLALVAGANFENMREASLDYYTLVKPWIDVFGRENVVVRAFEKDQLIEGNLLRDFCHAAELPQIDYDFDVPNSNVSFNMELYDMLKMYNSVFEEPFYSANVVNYVYNLANDPFFSHQFFSRFSLPLQRRIDILKHCEESNRKVAREYMGRVDGVLFREPEPSADDPYTPYSGLTMEKLVPILLQILHKQDQRIGSLEAKFLEKDQQLKRCSDWFANFQKSHTWRWFARFTVGQNRLPLDPIK